jgi:hypothetical protein
MRQRLSIYSSLAISEIHIRMRMGLVFFYSGIVHSSKDRSTIGYRLLETYGSFGSAVTDPQC